MSQYNWDVFISYRRSGLIEPWVKDQFQRLFKEWLPEKLEAIGVDDAPRIYVDQLQLVPGDLWPQELQAAVKTSKVLIAICSPTYFSSKWCKSEWETFIAREKQTGKNGLLFPVRHNDCEPHLQGRVWQDFYGLTYLAPGFYQSAQAIEFEKKVEDLAAVVAQAIKNAPPYDDNWPLLNIPSVDPPTISIPRL